MAFDELNRINEPTEGQATGGNNWDQLTDRQRKERFERYKRLGLELPEDEGVIGEIKKTAIGTGIDVLRGFGSTIEETTGYSGMREHFDEVKRINHQYDPDPTYSPSSLKPSHVARTVTTGAVQSLGAVGAGMLGTAIAGPAGGMAAAGGVTFGQIYGDTVKEYRDAMPGEDESVVKGLAFISAAGQSMLETIIGPEKMIAGFGKSFFSGALKETTKSLARRIGAEAAKGAVSEGAEEVLQDFWNRICKGVAAKEGFQPPSWEEVRDQFMGGALPGAVLGGVAGVREARTGTDVNGVARNGTENAGTGVPGGAAEGGAGPIEGAPSTEAPIPVSEDAIIRGGGQTAAEAFFDEIGIKHSRMTPEEQNTEGIGYVMQDGKKRIANGLFDRNTNEIKINPTNEGEMFTHGHELDHWLEKNHPDLARQLHVIMDSELNAAGLAENQSPIERRADMLGYLFEDPKTLKRTVEIGEANQAGFGEKFLNAVIEFSKQVMEFMKGHADLPGAEKYFNNYKKVRNTASQILAELKSREKAEQEKIKAETPELEMAGTANDTPDRPDRPNRQGADGNVAGGAARTVRRPDGSMEVPATFKVIPIEAAIHSGKAEYDQRFQPRNRDTKSSEAQIQKMSGEIHPEMLLDSPTTDTGAPIVDSKGQVISGNGRVMALLRARGQNIQDYYAAVRQFAAQNGIEIPEGLKNPLLVREVGDTDLVKLAELSNRDNKLRRTDAEQAEADAKTIMDSNLLDIFNPNDDGTIITGQNMDFLREFIQRAGDESLRNSDGSVASGAEQRVRRAVLAAMFQGRKNARTLIQNLIENATTDGLKRQVDGVTAAVGRIMKLTAREGYQGYDLREDLAQAFEALLEYKRELQINSKRYNSIGDYLKQGDMFERRLSPNAELLARFLGNAKSIRQIRDALNDYADHVERIDIHTDDMFGAKDEGKDSLLKRLLPGEETAETKGNADTANSIGPIRPIGPIGETAETKAETRDQKDSGRFNQNSETPFLTPEEDANDFQLTDQTKQEAAKRDQAAEKAEADKLERAKAEARRNAPDLPLSGDEKSDPYARIRETKEGSAERVKAFMELPDGEHELGGKKFSKQGNTFQRDGQKLSARGIEQSFRGVDVGNAKSTRGRSYTPAEEAEVYAELKKLEENDPEKPQFRLPDDKTVEELIREDIIGRLWEKKSMPEITLEKSVWLNHLRYLKSMTSEEVAYHDDMVKEDLNGRGETLKTETTPEGNTRLYSIAGEIGLRRLRWESKEALQRLENLELAKRLHKSGAKMDAIKFQTGWELGGDGKWRTELPDLKVKPGIDMILLAKKNPTLRDIVDAPEIFSAYSEVASTPVRTATFKNEAGEAMDRVAGAYDYGDDCFYISPKYVLKNEDEVNSVLTHEVQHKIQRIEGFAPGGNPEQFQGKSELLRAEVEDFRQKADASAKYRRYEQLDQEFRKFFVKGTDAEIDTWNAEFGKEYGVLHDDPEVKAINREKAEILKRFGNNLRVLQVLEDPGNAKAWDAIALDDDAFKRNKYRRLAGEVEARNAQRRSKMPLEERLKTLLARTEDVAEKDKIYLEKAVGEALMMTPLRRPGDPNRAGEKGLLRDGHVPHADGFMEWAGLKGKNLYADYEFLYARHSRYFDDQEHARAAVELVLSKPEQVKDMNQGKSASFVGFDEESGTIYRIEIEKEIRGKSNHIRSVFEITPEQYEKIKLEPSRVISDPSQNSVPNDRKQARTLSSFLRYNTASSADVNPDSQKNPENSEPNVQFSLVRDPGLLKKLDAEEKRGEYLTLYRAAQLRDGKLYSPMAAKINGQWPEPIQLGQWEQADEHPELIVKGNKFTLNKGNGATIDARYNPYIHSSPSPLNDQFSSAYKRPELVTLEVRVPKSELTSGYHAEHAKDSVGMQEWKAGIVSQKLSGRRQVMLSRYDKPVRIVPDSEVAQKIKEMLKGTGVSIPENVVTPSLRAELKKAGVKVEDGDRQYSLRKRQQINPIVVNGQVQTEYADLLDNREYTPETIADWDKRAIAWIDRQGGIEQAAELIANDTEHSDRHVATLVRRHILNSEFAASLPDEIRMAVELKNISEGTAWGREGAARRLAALTLKSIDSVKALFRKLHENMPDKEKVKLRNAILDQTGVDINNLPPDLVNNKSKLDKVLRAELANRSNKFDKAYEYWINAILSAPTTHSANIIGNTANTLYELGPKRFAEAAINTLAKRRDAATFGEFREMWNALDFRSAWKKAKTAFDLETLTPGGKFRENATVAIPGKLGRAVRTPGRLLVMADAFARELLIPAETAARAYREAKNQGLTGGKLRSYIQQQMSNPGSTAYQAGKASAERIIFQEDPGAVLQCLIQLKASDGPGAQILKYLLPFVKTPGNILKQGIRKSPLGSLNLAWETVQGLRGKRAFDSEYLGHAAEQLIAWGAFLALGGFGDDDDDARPFLTGSSAPSGSGENKFKANTVPPYSIRIGDTYYSYRRIEPLATGLAIIADAMQAIREVRNGKETAKALNDMLRKTGKMISEKSYLDSINQAVRFLEDPDRSLATFCTNFIASWVPNGLRAVLNARKDEVEDSKSRERGEEFLQDQLQVITSRMGFTSRAPKLDLFGHPITKEQQEDPDVTDFLLRLFVPVNRTAIDEDHPGKRLLLNYNASHPENQWWGSIPNYRFTHNKERYYFDNEAYHQFAAEAGKLAEKQIFNAVRHGVIHPDNPTEKDIEIMKKIFARARKETRAKFFKKAKKW